MLRRATEEDTHVADPHPDSDGDTGDDTGGTPRWVKVFGIIAVVVILLFVIMMFIGGGKHGPGRHMPGGDTPPGQHGGQRP